MNTHWLCCTLVATAFLATAACKGDESESGPQDGAAAHDGGGDALAIVPDAFAVASLQPGMGGACSFGQQVTLIEAGVATGTHPTTVSNGGSQGGAQVKVACTVHPDNNGYDIDLDVEIAGQGAMHVFSTGAGAVTSSGGTGISAAFSKSVGGAGATFSANDCTLTYTYQMQPISNPMPVAPGRIWGHVSCPDAQSMVDVLLPDGGTVPQTCDAEADFLFENCSE
jgi:hypothetical protein